MSDDVTRYGWDWRLEQMTEEYEGPCVMYEDYAKLREERDRLRAALKAVVFIADRKTVELTQPVLPLLSARNNPFARCHGGRFVCMVA